jgi:uncharacterized BrkB/YihY/UPF0761 family membrane protein
MLLRWYRLGMDAFRQFNDDDGWAIASHIALSALMALFPFLLVLTAVAGLFGSRYLADEGARILLETWPEVVAAPIALEIHSVLASARFCSRSILPPQESTACALVLTARTTWWTRGGGGCCASSP